jgi:paraquat-inducible protein A
MKHSENNTDVAVLQPASRVDVKKDLHTEAVPLRAIDLSLVLCHCCGLLNPQQETDAVDHTVDENQRCSRCNNSVHLRKPVSLQRTFAFLAAAIILYIPANILPMTVTESLLGRQQDTIMSGVIYFWKSGDYLVSSVIFMASIFIPMLKLIILAVLLVAVYLQSSKSVTFSPAHCATMYRIVEFIGRWSMIDVFVVALLAALIQIQSLATILAGPGAVAFGAVVVLTMLASQSFDPRMIWDNYSLEQRKKMNKYASVNVTDADFNSSKKEI